ncbi:SCO family protein [uncultured Albimonas sp.]|uniref:SCO family protein n=1 Tax=uncultured Albimonas sp. TaxID=1331701 RepID=UPI0030EE7F3A
MTPIRKRLLIAAAALAVATPLLGAAAWQFLPALRAEAEEGLGRGDYRLVSAHGSVFTEDTLEGAPSAVFFGFTHCPEVCPTTLGEISFWMEELGEEAGDLRVFFVTVDPERDTPEVLGDYVSWVDRVTAVTGEPAEIAKAIKAFKVYAAKVPLGEGGYTMDHSALVMLFDAHGRYADLIRYQEDPATVLPKLRKLVAG